MSGWLALGLLAFVSLIGLILIGRLSRALWQVAASAILLAMTGYALQGRPSLSASPAKPVAAKNEAADALLTMRAEMDRSFGVAQRYLITADSFSRSGDYKLAAGYIQSGLREYPGDADLWTALGLQLMLASDGQMSPPAKLAFDKARLNWPQHPGPDYYQGLADLFAGDISSAISNWEAALAKGTPNAKWRPRLESQLAGAKALQAQTAAVPENKNPSN
jgi:cytochrome c-type biogenesis protein CcmH